MSITNLLAQGFNPLPAEIQQNALMAGQQMRDARQRNALMAMQLEDAQQKRAEAQRNALMLQQWRDGLQVPQETRTQIPGAPAMNAAQAESAMSLPGYGVSSATPRVEVNRPDPRLVQAIQMAKAGQMSPADLFKIQNPDPVKMGKDDRLFMPGPGGSFRELVGAAPKEKTLPTSVQEFEYAQSNPNYDVWNRANNKSKASNISLSTGQKGYENESKLRNDFRSEPIYREYADMQTAHKQVKAGLNSANPIGDVAAATKIMKLLDPGSVVRESELAIAMNAAGKLDRLQNYVQMKMSGELLTPTQRKEFGELADELFEAAGQAYNKKRAEYVELAGRYGLNDSVLGPEHKSTRAARGPAGASKRVTLDDGSTVEATQGADGKFYVRRGGKLFRVEE